MRLNFYVPRMPETELPYYQKEGVDLRPQAFGIGWMIWITQTRLLLEQGEFTFTLSRELDKSAVNIGHVDDLASCSGLPGMFLVSVQADRKGFLPFVQSTIVENKKQVAETLNRYWLPHWPQPGLRPRSTERKGVKTAAYAGSLLNLGLPPHLFAESCRRCGLEPRLLGRDRWHDYSDVDILVGMRSLDLQTHDDKPASKLINAWLARIPFGGYDSAFSEAGRPGFDYLRISSRSELEEALVKLRDDQDLYEKLVSNGQERSVMYNREAVGKFWTGLLSGPIRSEFLQWENAKAAPAN